MQTQARLTAVDVESATSSGARRAAKRAARSSHGRAAALFICFSVGIGCSVYDAPSAGSAGDSGDARSGASGALPASAGSGATVSGDAGSPTNLQPGDPNNAGGASGGDGAVEMGGAVGVVSGASGKSGAAGGGRGGTSSGGSGGTSSGGRGGTSSGGSAGTAGGGRGGTSSGGSAGTSGSGGTGSTAHRYVKLLALSEQTGHVWSSVAELQVMTTGGVALDRKGWTIKADSEELTTEVAPATNAIDNDTTTYWHSHWVWGAATDTPLPHYLIVDLGAAKPITGFSYLPRQTGVNGRVKAWEFYVSDDGVAWGVAVKSGAFPDGTALQTVTF